jgi:hypothetical protein
MITMSYAVEEEVPPRLLDSTDPITVDPTIQWDEFWNEQEDTEVPLQKNPDRHSLSLVCRLMTEHLDLIFKMIRDLAEQRYHQNLPRNHMDFLFNSLSGEPAKSHFLTCSQPYAFIISQDRHSGFPHV